MSLYTLPGATRDFDFVIDLKKEDVEGFSAAFAVGYYCEKSVVEEALTRHSMFNVIDFAYIKNETQYL